MSDTTLSQMQAAARPARAARATETCRMFETDFFEKFSRIHPATIFVVWIPVATIFMVRAILRAELDVLVLVASFAGGMLTWSLAEYVLHRHVFHWTNGTAWGRRIHFLLHGVHHDFPSDKDRLVMPLPTSIPLGGLFYGIFFLTMGLRFADPFFAGFVIGYLFYDGTHYFVHHFRPKSRWGRFLRRHHMTHHHADHDGGFGVSTPIWDFVFRTMPQARRAAPDAAKNGTTEVA